MADHTTELILGDAAADATSQGRRGLRRRPREAETRLTHCENCGAALTGRYCAECGQHAIDYRRSLWRVLVDAADSFFNWDTKFLSTLGVLLTRPWKLTNDFNAGRRARYVHPLRLYLLASVAFFLMTRLIHISTHDVIRLDPQDRPEIAAALAKLTGPDSVLTAEQRARVEAVRGRLLGTSGPLTAEERSDMQDVFETAMASTMRKRFGKSERAQLKAAIKKIHASTPETVRASAAPVPEGFIGPPLPPAGPGADLHFIERGGDRRPNSPLEAWMESRIKNRIGMDGSKATLFLETLRNNIPTMMLFCIPVFAFILKILYLRQRRFYVEHLIYALHIHTFIYVAVTLVVLAGMGIALWSETARVLVATALGCTIAILVLASIRKVYRQGWFFTAIKFVVGGIAYTIVLSLGVGLTAIATLLLPD